MCGKITMILEEVQAAFVAQLEFNRPVQQQSAQNSQAIAALGDLVASNRQAIAELTTATA